MDTSTLHYAQTYITRARKAQHALRRLSQRDVDLLSFHCAKAVYQEAESLATLAVTETGMGNVRDKILKKKAKAEATWAEIKDKKTVGIIKKDDVKRMIYYADPLGVVAGVAPCTNPIATAMFYTMICLKTRNSLIISPHPRAIRTTHETLRVMRQAMAYAHIPDDVVQVLDEPQLSTKEMMHLAADVMSLSNMVVATGGPKLVDVAYHSGRPAYGVGAGNTPVYIHPSCDVPKAMDRIVTGRAFDNGIICASEQHIISTKEMGQKLEEAIQSAHAYLVRSPEEKAQLTRTIFDEDRHMRPDFIGKSASYIAKAAGLTKAESARALIVPIDRDGIGTDPYSGEKLCPILSWLEVDHFEKGLDTAEQLLNFQGKGHSAAIHIDEKGAEDDLLAFAERMPATHIIVNMPAATSSGGSRYNWLTPSTTLGCGAYGGTMPMETINLSVKQLINYKAVAMPLAESRIPDNVFDAQLMA